MKTILFGLLVLSLLAAGCVSEEFCADKESGAELSYTEAKAIAVDSECGDNLKKEHMCNEYTGTWWIDLDLEKQGCNPACVVDVNNKTAEINWRCTGLIN